MGMSSGKVRVLLMFLGVLVTTGCGANQMRASEEGGNPRVCKDFVAETSDHLNDSYMANRHLWQTFNERYQDSKPRKLVVFMDGTGNNKSSSTNVRKLYRLSVQQACSGIPVIPYYDKGVGAKWFDRIRGGFGGRGTSLNIRQAYRFLVEAYKPGDEIYIFGFSRGAFTARSLNGFIEFAGLIDRDTIQDKLYDGLPLPGLSNLHFTVKALYEVYHSSFDGTPNFESDLKAKLMGEREKQGVKSHEGAEVSAIGVFDTVPALGIFLDDEPDDHRLDLYARRGFHALSLDEQRDSFRLLRFDPLRMSEGKQLSEVWFAGVHSDIGGSYSKSYDCIVNNVNHPDYYAGLATTPLNWMIRNFDEFQIFPNSKKYAECDGGRLHDEYFDGASWVYKDMGVFQRRPRIGDRIHNSVVRRMSIQKLDEPHEKREPGGQYLFMNLPPPVNVDKYFEKNFIRVE